MENVGFICEDFEVTQYNGINLRKHGFDLPVHYQDAWSSSVKHRVRIHCDPSNQGTREVISILHLDNAQFTP